jgi:ketosteroid isomerase-like protein
MTSREAIMTDVSGLAANEAQIRALIDARVDAVRAKDVDAAFDRVAADIVSFDVVEPLRHVGRDALKKRAKEWFSTFDGPIGYEIRDLQIVAGDEVGFSHGLSRFRGTTTDGRKIDMWVRASVCYRKVHGRWMVTHEHTSVPFDGDSGQGSVALKP